MLICSSFFSNSKRVGLNCEKSRLERSWARNASAARSVLSRGTFLFIGLFFDGQAIAAPFRVRAVEEPHVVAQFLERQVSKRGPRSAAAICDDLVSTLDSRVIQQLRQLFSRP